MSLVRRYILHAADCFSGNQNKLYHFGDLRRSSLGQFAVLLLACIQFAFKVSRHIIFLVVTICLASHLSVLESVALRTSHAVYGDLRMAWAFEHPFNCGYIEFLIESVSKLASFFYGDPGS